MLPGIYFDAVNGVIRQKELEIISQNIANLSTPGYKKEKIAFSKYLSAVICERKIDFSQGDLQPTSNPFDIAISGENAFFVVRTKDGKELFTRRGDFSVNSEKKLVTKNGFYVQGEKGDIVVNGNFQIIEDGKLIQNGKVIDKLKIVSLPLDKLQKYGYGMFFLPEENRKKDVIPASNYKIFQGYLERSNVKPIEAMVMMINCLKNYEMSQKSIQAQDETASKLINEVGTVRI